MNKKEYMKKYYSENKNGILEHNEKWRQKHLGICNKNNKISYVRNRIICLSIYSNNELKCKYCGYDNIDALDIDHINNDGYKFRQDNPQWKKFHKYLMKNNFPSGYQVLCKNCNWLKRLGVD